MSGEVNWAASACLEAGKHIFFDLEHVEEAVEICEDCPIRTECRDYAVKHGIIDGVWGGLTPNRLKTMAGVA